MWQLTTLHSMQVSDCGYVLRGVTQRAKCQSINVWNQLFSVSMAALSQCLVSASEADFCSCHLPLKICSLKIVFINTKVSNSKI